MSRNVNLHSLIPVGILALAAVSAALWTAGTAFPVPARGPSLLVLAATFGIAFLASLEARPRWRDEGADEHGEAAGLLRQVDAAKSPRSGWTRSLGVLLLPLALLAAGPALSAEASMADKIIVARGDGIALASVCRDGQYMLFVTNRPETEPWKKRLQAVEPTDSFAITLEYGEKAADNERLFFRMEELPGSWSIPTGRTYTRELEAVSVPQDLHLRIWFPGEDRSGPGHLVREATQEMVARMWLNAVTC